MAVIEVKKKKKKHSKDFKFWKMCWGYGVPTIDQMHEATFYKSITKAEYKEITGQNYEDFVPTPVTDEDEDEDEE